MNPLIKPPYGLREILEVYGNPKAFLNPDGTLSTKWESNNLVYVDLPKPLYASWNHDLWIERIRAHKHAAPFYEAWFLAMIKRGLDDEVKSLGGAFNYRTKRFSENLSTHSWGIAIDLNPERNPVDTIGDWSPEFIKTADEFGFMCGNMFKKKDPMHFQLCSGY